MIDALLYVAAIVGALGIFFLGLYSLHFLFQYQIQPDGIHYKLFGLITVGRISLNRIGEVHLIQLWSPPYGPGMAWPSKVFQKSGVLIRTHSGIPRVYILSPDNPTEFVDQIKKKLHSRATP